MPIHTDLQGEGTFVIRYKDIKTKRLLKVKNLRSGSWIEVVSDSEVFLAQVAQKLNLDPSIVLDVLDQHEIPRLEYEEEGLYLFARIPIVPENSISTMPVLLVVTSKYLVTFSTGQVSAFTDVLKKPHISTTQRTKLVIQLFLLISKTFQQRVLSHSKELRILGTDLAKIRTEDINQMVKYQMMFDDYLAALEPSDDILEELLSGKYIRLYEEDKEMIEDVLIATTQLIDMCKRRLKRIYSIRDAYATVISNNLNQTMKRLTALTVILTLPTMVFSFYGMNVPLPYGTHPVMWLGLIILTMILIVSLVKVFSKRDLW